MLRGCVYESGLFEMQNPAVTLNGKSMCASGMAGSRGSADVRNVVLSVSQRCFAPDCFPFKASFFMRLPLAALGLQLTYLVKGSPLPLFSTKNPIIESHWVSWFTY